MAEVPVVPAASSVVGLEAGDFAVAEVPGGDLAAAAGVPAVVLVAAAGAPIVGLAVSGVPAAPSVPGVETAEPAESRDGVR